MATPDCCAPGSQAMDSDVASRVATVLKSLADPLRLRMLSLISTTPGGEACVCDIATVADVSQPTVSHHLKVLKDTGVLTAQRRGTWVYYRVAPDLAGAVAGLLSGFAPAVSASAGERTGGLVDVEDRLTRVADELEHEVPGAGPETVLRTVRESYTALARTGSDGERLVARTERFARQRLLDVAAATDRRDGRPPQVLFVCVANAGRSQIAAALVRHYAGDAVTVRSAGSHPAAHLHPGVADLLDGLARPTPEAFPKPVTDDAVRAADVVVTMGCGDACPVLPGVRYEDWVVGDPALASPAGVRSIAAEIDRRVRALLVDLVPDLELPPAPVLSAA